MQGWYNATQLILHILSNPAWSGISSICSLIGIPLAIHLARNPKTTLPPPARRPHLIKKIFCTAQLYYLTGNRAEHLLV